MKTGKVADGMLAFTVLMQNMTLRLFFFCPFPRFFLLDTSSVFVYKRFFAENERMSLDMKRLISFFWENECTSRVSVIWRVAVCEEGSRRVNTHISMVQILKTVATVLRSSALARQLTGRLF